MYLYIIINYRYEELLGLKISCNECNECNGSPFMLLFEALFAPTTQRIRGMQTRLCKNT